LRQTFSSAVPLVQRALSVLQQQMALLEARQRESATRICALAAELEQNAQVKSPRQNVPLWARLGEREPRRKRTGTSEKKIEDEQEREHAQENGCALLRVRVIRLSTSRRYAHVIDVCVCLYASMHICMHDKVAAQVNERVMDMCLYACMYVRM